MGPDPKTRNMDIEALATKLESAERDGTLPKELEDLNCCVLRFPPQKRES